MNGPDFLIIGAMKAATSTLHEQLAASPAFFMSRPKEPNFFSDDDQWARGMDWYRGLFAAAAPGQLRGESSTHYTKLPDHPHAAERIAAELGPDLRFVYVMRHPIDRLVSHYVHEWTQNAIGLPIDEAIERHSELIDYGCYARQLAPYRDRFGPQAVLPVFFERLAAAPQAELERVARFLGYAGEVRWVDEVARQNVSSARLRRSPLREAILDLPGLTALRRRLVPRALRDRLKAPWQMRERPELSDAARRGLVARFDADLEQLGAWLGRPVSCAGWSELTQGSPPEWSPTEAGSAGP